jgi:hypothetical protein
MFGGWRPTVNRKYRQRGTATTSRMKMQALTALGANAAMDRNAQCPEDV